MGPYGMALLGGAIIGLAVSGLLLLNGRICGISGILAQCITPGTSSGAETRHWRLLFVLGLLAGGLAIHLMLPSAMQSSGRPMWLIALAGGLVGFGTRMGSGCTSGHGICGLVRLSPRSILATVTFVTAAAATATLYGWLS